MTTKRPDRVAALLRSALADLLRREVKDPRLALVTVTGVEVSPDLKHARVFVSAFGDEAEQARALAGVESARAYLRAHLGRRLALRFTPELRFLLDRSSAQGEHMERLLRGLRRDDPDPSDEPD